MDCRTFQKYHLAFVDETLPGADHAAMERHRVDCETCARHDSQVRRGLFLARNITSIEPSPDFLERLQQRLRTVQPDRRPVYVDRGSAPALRQRLGNVSSVGTAAVAVAACALMAVGVASWNSVPRLAAGAQQTSTAAELMTDVRTAQSPDVTSSRTTATHSRVPATRSREQAASTSRGYSLVIDDETARESRHAMTLFMTDDMALDPAIVTSASVGLSVWPTLMIPNDLPRAFREAGFSVAGLAH